MGAKTSPSVRLPKGKSLKDLDTQDREVVENWKAALSDAFRPVYNNLRDQHNGEKIVFWLFRGKICSISINYADLS